MVDYREILRLSELYSQRQIAASVGSSRHTISEVLETADAKGIPTVLRYFVRNLKPTAGTNASIPIRKTTARFQRRLWTGSFTTPTIS